MSDRHGDAPVIPAQRFTIAVAALAVAGLIMLTPARAQEPDETPVPDITVTVRVESVAISIEPGTVDFGPIGEGDTVRTDTQGPTQTIRNVGGAPTTLAAAFVDLSAGALSAGAYGANCDENEDTAEWEPTVGTPGGDQFRMRATIDEFSTVITLAPSGQATQLGPDGALGRGDVTLDLDFELTAPSSTAYWTCSIPLVIIAIEAG